jgi:hyperosmotically inducible protein
MIEELLPARYGAHFASQERRMYRHESSKISFRSLLMAAGLVAGINIGMPAMAADAPAPQAHSDSMGAAISDSDITAKVKVRLMDVKILKKSDIDVTTTNGVVTLTGTASSSKAKSTAESMTASVTGVRSVDNELKTPSGSKAASKTKKAAAATEHAVTDSWITTKVKSELLADSITKGFKVNVVTTHGVVVLSGKLPSQDAIEHAKGIVEKVDGVKSVDTGGLAVSGK